MAKVKRSRAAYMKEYRAARKAGGNPIPRHGPTVASLSARIDELEAQLADLTSDMAQAARGIVVQRSPGFGSPRPAPKGK